jgi:hypothetical protein
MRFIDNIRLKIKRKLKSFLGIYSLEDIVAENQKSVMKDIYNHENNIKWLENQLADANEKIDALHKTISSVVSIGADITTPYDNRGSWAVVCIEGNYNVVKFINLRGQYGRDILHFLKQFEASRYVIDAPMGLFSKDMFIDWK